MFTFPGKLDNRSLFFSSIRLRFLERSFLKSINIKIERRNVNLKRIIFVSKNGLNVVGF